ncbi:MULTISPECIES: type II toxin-antitoxin system RelE/ParE family toxin [Pseudomonas]|uniref:Addiction module protein n=1 Tax=Pseudomonas palleroniana TaxID=191390 RepID=A0A0X7K2Q1_9PSED|nr:MULTISPECIES: type II toxin-antitoxin system RelE/ParE family toxin [Pseudomonas]KWU49916.1 addiction module protein [Pseudomonas palleroniana]NCE83275.1 type II toxin-antitoxin system RelE/ParE family toxin [Pseudomonas sp. Q1]UOP13662.1 type II toxin-antitoxin system RelE/ParE family toxin [Pseudomonas palleroniana]
MIRFKRSAEFQEWFHSLRDKPARGRVLTRLDNATMGNFGDCETVGNGVSEMRIHYGPGYRVYFMRIGEVVYLLLIGGDKSTQQRDIQRAKQIADEFRKKGVVHD